MLFLWLSGLEKTRGAGGGGSVESTGEEHTIEYHCGFTQFAQTAKCLVKIAI